MISMQKAATRGMAILAVAATAACSSAGGLGNILGSVLGQGQQGQGQGQVSGTIQSINTRNQQVQLQQSNGQNLTLGYDNQTQVVYQNQNYSVNSLEYGDRVTARITNASSNNNNQYYTDLIQVDQSVSSNPGGTGTNTNVQQFEGTARNIDRTNGTFQLTGSNFGTVVVSLPYNPRQTDVNRFQSLRSGDYVRMYGIVLNNNRVELRQFN